MPALDSQQRPRGRFNGRDRQGSISSDQSQRRA